MGAHRGSGRSDCPAEPLASRLAPSTPALRHVESGARVDTLMLESRKT
jgi:hypothetical protein